MPETLEETKEVQIEDIAKVLQKLREAQNENSNLRQIINKDREQLEARFEKLQIVAVSGIEAAKLILEVITNSDTAHWQKKENIRNAIGVLQTLQARIAKADPSPLPFDDDF